MPTTTVHSTIIPIQGETEQMPEPQTRGYFMSLVRNLSPTRLTLEIRRVASAGFNLLVFPVYNNGWTLFPSEAVLSHHYPAINPLFRKWDPLAHAVEVARAEGMQVAGFARLHNFHPRFSLAEHKLLRAFPRWRMRAHPDHAGPSRRLHEERHACPLNHEYRRFAADLLCEAAERYPIEGILLNYTGLGLQSGPLPETPYCFCASCQRLYEDAFGASLVEDARTEMLGRVRLWQLEQAHDSLSYIRHRLARTRRTMRLTCCATPDWRDRTDYGGPLTPGSVLMDWPELLHSGLVEELVVHHDDEPCGDHFSGRVAADYAYLGDRVLFLPMVRVQRREDLKVAADLQNRLPVPGFIAEFQGILSDEDAEFIRENYFPGRAMLPESNPVMTAAFLLDRVRQAHPQQLILRDLLGDMLRLLSRQLPLPSDFELLEVVEENLMGLEQAIRRGRLKRLEHNEAMMCDLGLARRYIRLACLDVRS